MYSLLRKIHLFSGLVLSVFVLMYFITGFIMIFESSFKREVKTEVKERIPYVYSVPDTPDELARQIQDALDIRGQYSVQFRQDQAIVSFTHPGTLTEVRIPHRGDSLFVTTRHGNVYTVMHQYHRLHGYRGGVFYSLWAFIYDLSSISMIVFAVTGLYLWYKTERKRTAGWLVLGGSTLVTAATIVYLMFIS